MFWLAAPQMHWEPRAVCDQLVRGFAVVTELVGAAARRAGAVTTRAVGDGSCAWPCCRSPVEQIDLPDAETPWNTLVSAGL